MEKNKVIVIAGPTGVGKTKLSIELAKKINSEIVSADSMQIYKNMDIGTAKIKTSEMQGIEHHMIDIVEPHDEYNIVNFQKEARKCIKDIINRKKTPIIVGGTGFYIQALIRDVKFENEEVDNKYKEILEFISTTVEGNSLLYKLLEGVDELSSKKIHPNNTKRVIRALEFYDNNGYSIQRHNEIERDKTYIYDTYFYFLNDDRNSVYKRIDERVDLMMDTGLINEVEYILKSYGGFSKTASMGIGYKEVIDFLNNKINYEECVNKIKTNSRHYAKRQITWFNALEDIKKIDISKYQNFMEVVNFVYEDFLNSL